VATAIATNVNTDDDSPVNNIKKLRRVIVLDDSDDDNGGGNGSGEATPNAPPSPHIASPLASAPQQSTSPCGDVHVGTPSPSPGPSPAHRTSPFATDSPTTTAPAAEHEQRTPECPRDAPKSPAAQAPDDTSDKVFSPPAATAATAATATVRAPSLEVTESQRREFNRLVTEAHRLLASEELSAALAKYIAAQRIVNTDKVERRISKIKAKLAELEQPASNDEQDAANGGNNISSSSNDDGAQPGEAAIEVQSDGWAVNHSARMAMLGNDFRIPLSSYSNLYPHQREGVRWLAGFVENKVGGILGDDMGMGKTVQVATFLRGALAKTNGVKTVRGPVMRRQRATQSRANTNTELLSS